MNIFLTTASHAASDTGQLVQNEAPWWIKLIVGAMLFALGVFVFLKRKPYTEAELQALSSNPQRIDWRLVMPVIVTFFGLWAMGSGLGLP